MPELFFIRFLARFYFCSHLFINSSAQRKNINQEQYDRSGLLLMLIPVSSVFIMFTFLAIGETSAFAQPVDFMVTICAVFCWWSICLYLASTNIIRKITGIYRYAVVAPERIGFRPILWNDAFAKWKSKYSDPWYKKHLQSIKLLNEKMILIK